ncbi:hypothetical protein [Bowmanella dokdonensis]|uniref:Uncharacterized protein n=1 Tax=Bowmanella dokdonensis TaxID=751969 RepID=A0A939DQT7_9ALTE|nr:hypothetical protein [Bowmanella dokdonensis]MBN7827049.1 hypothetical protein [Bowmanella dokdonensis]
MQSGQTDIFRDDQAQLHYAELCNALYERELLSLAQSSNLSLLKRRLKGLSHHIKRVASSMLAHQGPLELDIHNASWQARHAAHCPGHGSDGKLFEWLHKHACLGLPVPVWLGELGCEHLELDSVDRIDRENRCLHLNKHGWFSLDGTHQDHQYLETRKLLLPTKPTLTAACCGHSWKHQRRTQPRTLSLRELLLSNQINWKNFRKPL